MALVEYIPPGKNYQKYVSNVYGKKYEKDNKFYKITNEKNQTTYHLDVLNPFKYNMSLGRKILASVSEVPFSYAVNRTLALRNWVTKAYYNPREAAKEAVNYVKNHEADIDLAVALAPLPVRYAYNRAKAKVQTALTNVPGGTYVNAAIDYATGVYTPKQEISYYNKYLGKTSQKRAIVGALFNKVKQDFKNNLKQEKEKQVEDRRINYREMKEKALNARLQRGVNRYMYGKYKYDNRQSRYNEGGGFPSRYESTGGNKYKTNRYRVQRKRIPKRIYFQLRKEGKIRWYHGNMIILPNRFGY